MSAALMAFLVAAGATVVVVAQSLLADEARGWLPHLSRALARSAARRMPAGHRERYEEEWLAELHEFDDRPLTQLVHAAGMVRGGRRLRRELPAVPAPSPETGAAEPPASRAPVVVDFVLGDGRQLVYGEVKHLGTSRLLSKGELLDALDAETWTSEALLHYLAARDITGTGDADHGDGPPRRPL